MSNVRWLAATFAGPVIGTVNGDFPRPRGSALLSFQLLPVGRKHIASLTIDVNATDLEFFNPVNFILADSTATVTSISRTPDFKTITLTFAPQSFGGWWAPGIRLARLTRQWSGFFQI